MIFTSILVVFGIFSFFSTLGQDAYGGLSWLYSNITSDAESVFNFGKGLVLTATEVFVEGAANAVLTAIGGVFSVLENLVSGVNTSFLNLAGSAGIFEPAIFIIVLVAFIGGLYLVLKFVESLL